ncbi:MAG: carbonic anhydrase [Betaproteobacteria bacterium]|nr:carbonic anhydrase [Betaproteobacteria bacterium]
MSSGRSKLILAVLLGWSVVAHAETKRTPDLTIVTDAEQARAAEAEKEKALAQRAAVSVAADSHIPAAGKSPRESLELLRNGNQRFVEGKAVGQRRDEKTRSELATGQNPFAVVLSCSDSRVPPELVFDQGLGDVFVVRTAGHVLDPGPIASIEYALEHLGARLIVVLGHESCGVVKKALTTPVGKSAGSVDLDRLVAKIKPYLSSFRTASTDKRMRGPVKANTSGVARELVRKSAIVRTRLQLQEVALVTAIYGLSTGQVEFNMWDLDYSGQAEVDATPVVEAIPAPGVRKRRGMAAGGH